MNDYLKDIEVALYVLNDAIDSVDHVSNNSQKIHPSIGNRLYTAKSILAEVLESVIADRERDASAATIQSEANLNTKISYLYRDASNYKVHNECVISGILSKEQQNVILNCLDEGEYFIPSLVGMPEVKFDEVDDPEEDHQWFELEADGFSLTKKVPQVDITPDELVAAFSLCNGNWNDFYVHNVAVWPLTASQQNIKKSLDTLIDSASTKVAGSGKTNNELVALKSLNMKSER